VGREGFYGFAGGLGPLEFLAGSIGSYFSHFLFRINKQKAW